MTPIDDPMVCRILAHYDAASVPTLTLWGDVPTAAEEGTAWYDRASDTAAALAAGSGLPYARCAGVIAALSPRVSWSVNVRAAAAIVDAAAYGRAEPVVAGLGANRRKAWRIATGADPADVLGGDKVRAFYANITGDLSAVTVDVWAASAALGRPVGSIGHAMYARIADAYRMAATLRAVSPRTMQAAVWCHVRGSAR